MLNIEQLKRAEKILLESQVEMDLSAFFTEPGVLEFDAEGKLETGHFCDSPACLAGALALSPDFPEITAYDSCLANCFYTNALGYRPEQEGGGPEQEGNWPVNEVIDRDVFIFSRNFLDEATKEQSKRLFGALGHGEWDRELLLHYFLNNPRMKGLVTRLQGESDEDLLERAKEAVIALNWEDSCRFGTVQLSLEEVCREEGIPESEVAHYRLLREMGVSQDSAREQTGLNYPPEE